MLAYKEMEYTTSITKKYWCHNCKKDFAKIYIESIAVQCCFCSGSFCEELEIDDVNSVNHPSHFSPYESRSNHNRRTRETIPDFLFLHNHRQRTTSSLLDFIISNVISQHFEDDIENIINHIMMNDPNKYGNPPASSKSINELKAFDITKEKLKELGIENTCSVCKEEFQLKEKCLLMPCTHHFHNDCLLPWLKERNSCPVCRYELPTDDEDFENKKKNFHT